MKREQIFFIIFAALILFIYGQSLWGTFVFDDRGILDHWGLLSNLSNITQVAVFPYWNIEAGLYRPTTLLSYMFNIVFLGGSAFSFHLVNLLIYFGICAAIYLLVKRLFKDEWLAFLSALVYLVLPIHTEVVANITGRSELLALFFSLLVLLEFTREKVNYWRAGLWLLLGLGAKETAIAAVPLALLLIYIREGINVEILKRYFKEFSALVVSVLVYFIMRYFVLGPAYFAGVETSIIENPLIFADTSGRIFTALQVLWMYVSKTFWPINLCSDYSFNQIPIAETFWKPQVLLGAGVLLGSIAAFYIFLKKKPIISFASAIFLTSFLPVANLVFPIGTIAGERLFFFPSLGLAMLAALLLSKIRFRWIALVLLIPYLIISFNQQKVWLSEERLFTNAAKCSPESVLSLSNLGTVYYFRGEYDKAQEVLEKSRDIKPVYSKGLNNLGLVYWKQGRNREAEQMYFESLRQTYPYHGAIENLVLLYISEGDEEKALRWLRIMYPNADDSALRNLF
jgi:protein O-mannosyl-transferase